MVVAAVLQGFGLIAVVIGVGWLLGRTGLFGEAEQRMLARLTFWVGSPALLFLIIAGSDPGRLFSGFLLAVVIGTVVATGVYLVLARMLWSRSAGHLLMGGMTISFVNSNNLGIPIAAYVLGDAAWAAPVLLFQLLVLQPVWLAALDVAGGGRRPLAAVALRAARSPVTNPLTIGSLLGLVVALTGVRLPEPVVAPLELLAGLAIPAMLLAFGISLWLSPRPGQGGTRAELATVVVAKLLLMPAVTYVVGSALLGLSGPELLAATVIAALPTAQNVYILALAYDRGVEIARDGVFLTTAFAVPAMLLTVAVVGPAAQ